MKTLFALLKREILEHKNIWRVPLILIGIAVLVKVSLTLGNLDVSVDVPKQFQLDKAIDSAITGVIARSLSSMNTLIMLVMFVVAIFYALSCLFNERQDQSVLFWRSLPISDTMTIASKLVVALVVIPLLIVVSQIVVAMLFLGSQVADYLPVYLSSSMPRLFVIVIWSLVPTIAWCLMCSAIARKNPFLLAFITPILVMLVDRLFLNGQFSSSLISNRFSDFASASTMAIIWALIFTVACIAVAVVKRSQRI